MNDSKKTRTHTTDPARIHAHLAQARERAQTSARRRRQRKLHGKRPRLRPTRNLRKD